MTMISMTQFHVFKKKKRFKFVNKTLSLLEVEEEKMMESDQKDMNQKKSLIFF